jgi:Cof subfamily protein (haloacid dehalogenase superfamily)
MQKMLVAVDVDGTLLDTEFDDVLRQREIDALCAVRSAGHEVALCTGRNLRSLQALLRQSGWEPDDLPLVLLNGALVWGGRPRRQLCCNLLDGGQVRRLVELFHAHDTVAMVYGADDDGGWLYHETRPVNDILGRYLDLRRDKIGAIEAVDDLLSLDLPRALEVGTIDERARISTLSRAIGAELAGEIRTINTRSLLGEGAYYWAEAYRLGSDKGTGVRTLAAECGVAEEDVVAIGDNYNDLDMFDVAGTSVAMANSPDEVKERADTVTGSVAEGGAAAVLEQIAGGTFPVRTN